MYTINDSMLTLILRFAGCKQDVAFSNQKFIQKQMKAIRAYVEQYPPEERKERSMEWIATRAHQYRETWEQESLTQTMSGHRCPDCPLSGPGADEHCQIHDQWVELLHQYITRKIHSEEYIESSLKLLAQNKEHLKIKHGKLKVRKAG